MHSTRRLCLAVSIALAAVGSGALPLPWSGNTGVAFAQEAGAVAGRVTDGAGRGVGGVRVEVLGGRASALTGADGGYRLDGVGQDAQVLSFQGAGQVPATRRLEPGSGLRRLDVVLAVDGEAQRLDQIVVRGQYESRRRAVNDKRAADAIADVVSADSMGRYPDQNVAESLQRVPGVSITRDQGEGRFVTIRGLDSALNSVTVNGQAIGTPEDAVRSATLDVIPSDSTERITVVKAPTPDMPGDSIGGSINIESASGFDREGRSLRGRVEAGYNELSGNTNPKASFNYSDQFDGTLGIAFGASFQDREYESDNVEAEYDYPFGDADEGGPLIAQQIQQRKYMVDRERFGTNLNIDLRPDADNAYYVRMLYSDFTDAETRQSSVYNFDGGELLGSDGERYTIGGIDADEFGRRIRWRTKEQDTFAVTTGGENRFDASAIDYRIGYTQTHERVLDEIEARFEYDADPLAVELDQSAGIPTFELIDPAGADYLDNDAYVLDRFIPSPTVVDDRELSAAFNVDFDAAGITWKTGLLGRWRDRKADSSEMELRDVPDLSLGEWTTGARDYRFGDLGDGIDSAAMLAWLRANRGEVGEREQDAVENLLLSRGEDYTASEDIAAGYFMGTFEFDALRVIAGVRAERTDFDTTGVAIETEEVDGDPALVSIGARSASNSYTSVLPGLHLRYDGANDWVLRGAYTETISRPGFGDASPRLAVNREDEEVEAGNPDLDPYESQNLDVSVERYIGNSGIVSLGLFHKSIDGYIVETTTRDDPQFPGFDVTRAVNGREATVKGLEFNAQQQLDVLPGAWAGLLYGVSATFLDATFDAGINGRDEDFDLPRASDRVYSAYLGYENFGLSARLAAQYRSEYLEEVGDAPIFDVYVAPHTQLDFTLNYAVDRNWELYFEASNLLDEPLELYQGERANTLQYEVYERTYTAGVRINL
uniref:TonB-dependent receptor n=1 Tax=Coralloluteibacterium stylophorae TaxID=1776034 RepID=A0A8J8AXV3_9GAMM